jgi:hypothetical protein
MPLGLNMKVDRWMLIRPNMLIVNNLFMIFVYLAYEIARSMAFVLFGPMDYVFL